VVVIKSYPARAAHSTLDKVADAKREAPVAELQNEGSIALGSAGLEPIKITKSI
jgi:hypothetical protein